MDMLPKPCGGVVKFDVMPIYKSLREKKLLTTTEEEDTTLGFPTVQLAVTYTDSEGSHDDSYKLTEHVEIGEYSTMGRVYCVPQSVAWSFSMYAAMGTIGFMILMAWVVNVVYSWRLWDSAYIDFGLKAVNPNDERFGDLGGILARLTSYVAFAPTKFVMAIIAAVAPVGTFFVNLFVYFFVINKADALAGRA